MSELVLSNARLVLAVQATVVLSDMTAHLAAISPTLAADPIVNPPAATWARLAVWAALDPRTEARYGAVYRQVTG